MDTKRDWPALVDLALRLGLTLFFAQAAIRKLVSTPYEVAAFGRYGYALWFMYAVGVAQVAAAALLLVPGWIAIGAGALAVLMVGAVASHLLAHDPVRNAAPAALFLVVLTIVAWLRRRELARWLPEAVARRL